MDKKVALKRNKEFKMIIEKMKDKLEKTDILESSMKKTHPHFKNKINIQVDNMILSN